MITTEHYTHAHTHTHVRALTLTRLLFALLLLLLSVLVSACSTAPLDSLTAPSAMSAPFTVRVSAHGSNAPIAHARVYVNVGTHTSTVYTDSNGRALASGIIGADIDVAVSAHGYAPMSARGVLTSSAETWAFFLFADNERMVQ